MDLKQLLEKHLQKSIVRIETFHPFYEEALHYMLQAGGKRFRPLLLLYIVKAKNPLLIPSALDPAIAIEFLHTYSLIHDDLPVMDNADLRRGKRTLHKQYDETTAVLVGDALNTHAFYLIANAALSNDTKVKLASILSYNGGIYGMVHGQILDCYFEKRRLDIEQLKTLHINKTAKLIAASLAMGGVIVDLSQREIDKLYEFGIALGLLFQIQDDLIDELSNEEEAGKTIGHDKDKNSFVTLLGIDGAFEEAQKLAHEVEKKISSFDPDIREILQKNLHPYIYRHQQLKGQ